MAAIVVAGAYAIGTQSVEELPRYVSAPKPSSDPAPVPEPLPQAVSRPAPPSANDVALPDAQTAAAPHVPRPAWLANAAPSGLAAGDPRPLVAVVLDDVGVDRKRARRAVALPGPVTIALMTYAQDLPNLAATARANGHELMVHMPMEPDADDDPGPNALLVDLPPAEFQRRLEWGLNRFDGFVGINNHMGSKLTRDRAAMDRVMAALKVRGLLFLDSRTTAETQAAAAARQAGLPEVSRDLFIDNDATPIGVRTALLRVEEVARKQGYVVAIGHPRDATLEALAEWLPDMRARGFALVPLTAVVRKVNGINDEG